MSRTLPGNEAEVRIVVAAELADYASKFARQSELFLEASREVRKLRGLKLSAYILDLATKVGAATEELHDSRRWLTSLVRTKTLPP